MKKKLLKLQERLDSIDGSDFDMEELDTLQNEVISIENELDELVCGELEYYKDKELEEMLDKIAIGNNNYSTFYSDFEEHLRKAIKVKKGELEFYDPEDMLDMMFDREDPDFDEDSMYDD
jgi:hypothetical protein